MSDLLPSAASAIPAGSPFAAPRIAADPATLATAPAPLLESAARLRSASPTLLAAWEQAAAALSAEHTGAVLAASRPRAAADLVACASAVEELASGLSRAARLYAGIEAAAVPVPMAGSWTR